MLLTKHSHPIMSEGGIAASFTYTLLTTTFSAVPVSY